jgi:hypothetical protein
MISGKLSQRAALLLLILITAALQVQSVAAQNYRFAIPTLRLQVFVQPDASVRLLYEIAFENLATNQPIDIIDIGMPHGNYDLNNIRAWINDNSLNDIRHSEYVKPGVEVHLGRHAIGRGERGVFRLEATIPDLVYQDTTRQDYASLQITPTWFDRQFISGASEIWVVVHLLPGLDLDEILYQNVPFTEKIYFEEQPVVAWRANQAAAGPFLVGVSFPQRGMERVVTLTPLQLAAKWLEDNPAIWTGLIVGIMILFSIIFFRFSGLTGFSLFVILAVGLLWLLNTQPISVFAALPALLAGLGLNEYYLTRRKTTYLPALAHVEGGGIKRGLTAPEAAALLEMPLNKLLTLVIFGLLKKGALTAVQHEPLTVAVSQSFRGADLGSKKERDKERRKAAQAAGVVLHKYEHAFLDLIESRPNAPVHKVDFGGPMRELLKHAAERVSGFNINETKEYYRKIVRRAVTEAQTIGELPEWEKTVDRNMEWILMDENPSPVFTHRGYDYRPIWVRGLGTGAGSATTSPAPAPSGRPSYGGKTSFGDVAASFAGWTENTMGRLASSISPESLALPGAKGLVNLSGADRVTGDIFKALAEGGGSSSGGSSGGGCACAGCACACACAGGGR